MFDGEFDHLPDPLELLLESAYILVRDLTSECTGGLVISHLLYGDLCLLVHDNYAYGNGRYDLELYEIAHERYVRDDYLIVPEDRSVHQTVLEYLVHAFPEADLLSGRYADGGYDDLLCR